MAHTPLHKREIPNGYTLDWDKSIWNLGQVFVWSYAFDGYLLGPIITVRPNERLNDAYKRETKNNLTQDTEIFFVDA